MGTKNLPGSFSNFVTSRTTTPPSQGLREFLRGGYRRLDQPTVIYDRDHSPVGTWVPGTIDHQFHWTVQGEPAWLTGGPDDEEEG